MGKKAKAVAGKVLLGLVLLLISPLILLALLMGALCYLWDWMRWKCFHSRLPYCSGVSYSTLFHAERVLRKAGMSYEYILATEKDGRGAFRLETGLWLIDGGSEEEYFLDSSRTLYWEELDASEDLDLKEIKERGEPWRGYGEKEIPLSLTMEEMLAPYAGEHALVCYLAEKKKKRPHVHAALKDHTKTISVHELREQYDRK